MGLSGGGMVAAIFWNYTMNVVVLVDIFLSLPSNLCLCHKSCWIALVTSGCQRDYIAEDQNTEYNLSGQRSKPGTFFCSVR